MILRERHVLFIVDVGTAPHLWLWWRLVLQRYLQEYNRYERALQNSDGYMLLTVCQGRHSDGWQRATGGPTVGRRREIIFVVTDYSGYSLYGKFHHFPTYLLCQFLSGLGISACCHPVGTFMLQGIRSLPARLPAHEQQTMRVPAE